MAKVAVVTGASSGVGRATVLALAAAGWEVFAVARREAALGKTVEMAAADTRSRIHVRAMDVIDRAAVNGLAKAVLDKFGRVDGLVNAAGTNIPDRSLERMTEANFHEVFDVN